MGWGGRLALPPLLPRGVHQADPEAEWTSKSDVYEYGAAANPEMAPIPVLVHPPTLHQSGPTRVIPFDIDDYLEIDGQATSPNLMASFVRIEKGESIGTRAIASSQAFYVIRGSGVTSGEHGTITWSEGDLFVVPVTEGEMKHTCVDGEMGGAAIYWVHDQPLMDYIGCKPTVSKFEPTLYKKADLLATVEEIKHTPTEDGSERNRLGVLLGNKACPQTKTLTHVLWSLLNSIPAKHVPRQNCEPAWPSSAASRHQRAASAASAGRPSPSSAFSPSLNMASAEPSAAAARRRSTSSASFSVDAGFRPGGGMLKLPPAPKSAALARPRTCSRTWRARARE